LGHCHLPSDGYTAAMNYVFASKVLILQEHSNRFISQHLLDKATQTKKQLEIAEQVYSIRIPDLLNFIHHQVF
jgi:6,7-dimethyl-8-ribityllumazine synthase